MFLSIIPVAILLWFIIKRFIYNTDINQEQLIQYSPSEKSRITPAATLKQTHSTKVDSNSINDLNAPASTKFIDIKGAITLVNKKKERISIAVYPKDTLAKVDINNHRKTAIITGSCTGIGKKAAIFLAKKKVNLVVYCRIQSDIDLVVEEIKLAIRYDGWVGCSA